MAASLTANTLKCFSRINRNTCAQFIRCRWKPPDIDEQVLPPYEERLAAWEAAKEKHASEGVNIGLPFFSSTNRNSNLQRLRNWSKKRRLIEIEARHGKLQVDLEDVKEEWHHESGPSHIKRMAEHYGLFHDMFDGAHFFPTVPLTIAFDYDEEFVTPVYSGNVVPAQEVAVQPYVSYEANQSDSLWTLVMTSPDGNLESNDKELLHWMVCNIPQNEVLEGEVMCDYMQPFPVRGAGFVRYVFLLYKQTGKLDFSQEQRPSKCLSLRDRTFSTLGFYRQHEGHLTPAGLAFFQSTWDQSVRLFFHSHLCMPEPGFEFIHPPPYIPPQVAFPHKEPFNLYLDRYRDKKDIQEEVLKHKLNDADPFSKPKARPKYPNADRMPLGTPSWLSNKITDMRLGRGQWKDLYDDSKE